MYLFICLFIHVSIYFFIFIIQKSVLLQIIVLNELMILKCLSCDSEGSPLPELRSSDYYIDRTKPLPTSLQSDFIPEDILSALTQLPKPVGKDKLKASAKAKSTFPTDQKVRL